MNFLNIYPNISVHIESGRGIFLIDKSGRKYVDLIGGLGVNILGYHDDKSDRILSKLNVIPHLSNLYIQPIREKVAEELNKLCLTDSVFFTNSGTEANEAALKFAWKKSQGKVLAFKGSFHGRSLGSYSLSHLFVKQNFPRLNIPVEFVNWNKPCELRKKGMNAEIIFFEPIQGAAGVRVMSNECFSVLSELQQKGKTIIADEIQSGMGRTGKFLASMHWNFKPDIITLAKGLGGGLPLGAVCINKEIASNIEVGDHGTTMGGNLKALHLADVVLSRLKNGLMKHVTELDMNVTGKYREILSIRGMGLMLGFDVDNGMGFHRMMLKLGFIVNIVRGNKVRLLPPFIIEERELEDFFNTSLGILK